MRDKIIEQLDIKKIKMAIEPENHYSLNLLEIFPTIDSTNDYLLEKAKAGAPSGSICFAEQQTKGRGRRGRVWFSPSGANLYCSVLWYFSSGQKNFSALSIAIAVMVVSTLKKYGIQAGLELKWPNDILVQDRKLSGILLESLPEQQSQIAVVIGIGLNLNLNLGLPVEGHRDDTPWIDLSEILGQPVARNYLAGLLVNELLMQLPVYQTQGLKAFISDWQFYDALKGKDVVIHTAHEMLTGVMRGITEQGELLLEMDSGDMRSFAYGEVSVRRQ